jgi:hypothetical protein
MSCGHVDECVRWIGIPLSSGGMEALPTYETAAPVFRGADVRPWEKDKDSMKLPLRDGVHRREGPSQWWAGAMRGRGGSGQCSDERGNMHAAVICDFGRQGLDARPQCWSDRPRFRPMAAQALSWCGQKTVG